MTDKDPTTKTVLCRKYNKELPALPKPPMPGAKGQTLFESVSAQAWDEWTALQTRLINEMQLNMINAKDRKYLSEQLERFLNNESTDEAEGYAPESASPGPSSDAEPTS